MKTKHSVAQELFEQLLHEHVKLDPQEDRSFWEEVKSMAQERLITSLIQGKREPARTLISILRMRFMMTPSEIRESVNEELQSIKAA